MKWNFFTVSSYFYWSLVNPLQAYYFLTFVQSLSIVIIVSYASDANNVQPKLRTNANILFIDFAYKGSYIVMFSLQYIVFYKYYNYTHFSLGYLALNHTTATSREGQIYWATPKLGHTAGNNYICNCFLKNYIHFNSREQNNIT